MEPDERVTRLYELTKYLASLVKKLQTTTDQIVRDSISHSMGTMSREIALITSVIRATDDNASEIMEETLNTAAVRERSQLPTIITTAREVEGRQSNMMFMETGEGAGPAPREAPRELEGAGLVDLDRGARGLAAETPPLLPTDITPEQALRLTQSQDLMRHHPGLTLEQADLLLTGLIMDAPSTMLSLTSLRSELHTNPQRAINHSRYPTYDVNYYTKSHAGNHSNAFAMELTRDRLTPFALRKMTTHQLYFTIAHWRGFDQRQKNYYIKNQPGLLKYVVHNALGAQNKAARAKIVGPLAEIAVHTGMREFDIPTVEEAQLRGWQLQRLITEQESIPIGPSTYDFDAYGMNTVPLANLPEETQALTLPYLYANDAYLDGYLILDTYRFKSPPTDLENLKKLIQRVLLLVAANQRGAAALRRESKPLYCIVLYYRQMEVDPTGRIVPPLSYNYYLGTTDNLETAGDIPEEYPGRGSSFLPWGSDPNPQTDNLQVDMNFFRIGTYQLSRFGGSRAVDAMARLRQMKGATLTSESHKISDKSVLSWCSIETYDTKTPGACFYAALHRNMNPSPFKSYLPFMELIKTRFNVKSDMPLDKIQQVSRYFRIPIQVYDVEGNIIMRSPLPMLIKQAEMTTFPDLDTVGLKHKQYLPNPIRLLLFDNHYFVITSFHKHRAGLEEIEEIGPLPTVRKSGKGKRMSEKVKTQVFFDIETVNDQYGHIQPYSISFQIGDTPIQFFCTIDPGIDPIFGSLIRGIRRHAINSIRPHSLLERWAHYTLIAYNGSTFDFEPLFSYVIHNKYRIIDAPKVNGKIRTFTFYMGTESKDDHIVHVFASVWDPILFTATSLDEAAESFKLTVSKNIFNHDVPRFAFLSSDRNVEFGTPFAAWLNNAKEDLRNYNNQDIIVLRQVCEKMNEFFQSLGLDMYQETGIPSLGYNYWKRHCGTYPKLCHGVKNKVDDDIIRSSIIGGRCEGIPGIIRGEMRMLDVVSLYPFIMRYCRLPVGNCLIVKIGDEKNGLTLDEFNAYVQLVGSLKLKQETTITIRDEHLALLYIQNLTHNEEFFTIGSYRWDETVRPNRRDGQRPHPITPGRKKDGRLDWKNLDIREGYLPNVTMKLLLDYGAHVEYTRPEGKPIMYIWFACEPGELFANYVDKFYRMKAGEDAKHPDERLEVVRTMSKCMLNALSGKMSQRNFTDVSDLLYGREAVERLIDKIDKDQWIDVEPIGPSYAWVISKNPNAYKSPKPSQIGVGIYAEARSYMYRYGFGEYQVYYSDTDSMVISEYDFQDMRTRYPGLIYNPLDGVKKLGQFTDEYGCFEYLHVVCPKMYLIDRGPDVEPDKRIVYRLKGIRKRDTFKLRNGEDGKIEDNPRELFERLEHEGEILATTWQFKKDRKRALLARKVLTKKIRKDVIIELDDDIDATPTSEDPIFNEAWDGDTEFSQLGS